MVMGFKHDDVRRNGVNTATVAGSNVTARHIVVDAPQTCTHM